ncbi:peptide-methionine (S)-S-oxide reductase [Evansella vedderi]|uniref:peptide-methionine (S)-S-oxide reductase n=1 Tax=Evansella vedderi TaxID=38282 RepID=A0ABU0A0F5_9BACI|nr:peptide-methionine (S)-S-oxide reductase [Evansella vedderi]
MGDHTETIQIDFLPETMSYSELLEIFWKNHNPRIGSYKGRQYLSLLLFHNHKQLQAAYERKDMIEKERDITIETEVSPYTNFTLAEERHQKYYLKRYPHAMEKLKELYPDDHSFVNSTVIARLNGFVKGYGSLSKIKEEIGSWGLSKERNTRLMSTIDSIRW